MRDLTRAQSPLELVLKGSDPEKTVAWACGSCHIVARDESLARECCAPFICDTCGKDIGKFSYCSACSEVRHQKQEQAIYDKATKVPYKDYTGQMLCCANDNGPEGYHWDLDSLLDTHNDGDQEMPTWAWGTTEAALYLNAERILGQELESQDFYEEAFDNVSKEALAELQASLDAWLLKHPMTTYLQDTSTVVTFEEEAKARLLED